MIKVYVDLTDHVVCAVCGRVFIRKNELLVVHPAETKRDFIGFIGIKPCHGTGFIFVQKSSLGILRNVIGDSGSSRAGRRYRQVDTPRHFFLADRVHAFHDSRFFIVWIDDRSSSAAVMAVFYVVIDSDGFRQGRDLGNSLVCDFIGRFSVRSRWIIGPRIVAVFDQLSVRSVFSPVESPGLYCPVLFGDLDCDPRPVHFHDGL